MSKHRAAKDRKPWVIIALLVVIILLQIATLGGIEEIANALAIRP